jgi:hypothetical protein
LIIPDRGFSISDFLLRQMLWGKGDFLFCNHELTLQSCTLYRVRQLFLIGILEAAFSKAGCKCNVLFGFCGIVMKNIFIV